MKVGIIQNSPRTADLSNNLRHIVQGYRACLDHGAELVVASAHALCGPGLYDLAARDSFRKQMQLALGTLSRELGTAPLILGAYSTREEGDFAWEEEDAADFRPTLTPYLLENDVVDELSNGELLEWDDKRLFITTQDAPVQPGLDSFDLIVHLGSEPWYAALLQQEEITRQNEALNNEATVVHSACVSTVESFVYGGGSGIYSPTGKTLLRLPWFDAESRVADTAPPYREATTAQETESATLARMLQQGIRDTVRQYGYGGVCLSMDAPHSTLLAALAIDALGSANVEGVSFGDGEATARQLGISCRKLDIAPLLQQANDLLGNEEQDALNARMQATLLSTHSDSRGLLLLCPLSRREIMLGDFTLYGESCGMLAPLGNLYDMDLHMLQQEYRERYSHIFGTLAEPESPQKDIILHALADCNVSAGRFIRENNFGLEENEVHQIQRKVIASALKRSQLPFTLQVSAPDEQLRIPSAHRLND